VEEELPGEEELLWEGGSFMSGLEDAVRAAHHQRGMCLRLFWSLKGFYEGTDRARVITESHYQWDSHFLSFIQLHFMMWRTNVLSFH
jgi:hypothetical protein